LPIERDIARLQCPMHAGNEDHTQSLDGQHEYVEESIIRGQTKMDKLRPWCGQLLDRGRPKNRTGHGWIEEDVDNVELTDSTHSTK